MKQTNELSSDVVFAKLGAAIETMVLKHHGEQKRRKWSPLMGQHIVYGYETRLTFSGAAQLEAAVETAFLKKTSISEAVVSVLNDLLARGVIFRK